MNAENLRANYPKLISHMEESGYSEKYINSIKGKILHIVSNAHAWSCYHEMYQEYDAKHSKGINRDMRVIIGTIMQFDLYNKLPDGSRTLLVPKSMYTKLYPEFKHLIDYYCETERKSDRLKEYTITRNAGSVSSFLLSLQNRGITKLTNVTEEDVLAFFVSPEGVKIRSSTYSYCIRDVFKVCEQLYPEVCQKIISLVPKIRNTRKNICYITPPEAKEIRSMLNDEHCKLTLRDKAIGMLVYHTGLRWLDVTSLNLDSIDWEKDIINVYQSKTNEILELPLSAIVGNAIHDYLGIERPDVSDDALFLTQDKFPRRVGRTSRQAISNKILKEAGIRQAKGDRRGFHILRHHLTTTLLGNGVSQAIISATLGHIDPDSLESYLHSDIVNLRKCSLSIAKFTKGAMEDGNE